ncbi:phosphatase PAP2 family protein [Azohydromonas caseinilytica]|uniref:Phosphatase PAP2 family protein n=1 Tax=Azohydromonas caseinilytica TaxID=2728836 RepID=A0A848FCW3_9BURK|nr:phosphatase PAP2 family protein [Azohydromonas caseinilytica]NML17178.1 phosphatase PAP2 family protein [Azohydromonas caseinilytica]
MTARLLSQGRLVGAALPRRLAAPALGLLLLGAGLLLQGRHELNVALFLRLQALAAHAPDALWAGLSLCGLGWTAVLLAAAASRRDAWPVATMLWALVVGGALLHGIKLLEGMPRPAAALPPALVHVIGTRLAAGAMPSGHAASAVTVALLLCWRGTARRGIAPALALALLVGLARIAVGAHWPSDVLAGVGLGLLAAPLAVALEGTRPLRGALQRPAGQLLIALLQLGAAPGLVLQGHDPLAAPLAWALGTASALDGLRRAGSAWSAWRRGRPVRGEPLRAVAHGAAPAAPVPATARPARDAALPRGLWLAWAAAVATLFLLRLGAAPLFDVDEGAFAQATRELLASRDWWHTTLNGADRFDKPILVYWLQAASVALLGPTEAAVRLPSALCAIGWCFATAAFARTRWGDRAALAAGGVLACSLGVLLIGRGSTADALLNLLLVLALFDLWRHLESGARTPLRRAALWIALAVLAKGPIGLLVPGATLLLWVLARRRRDALRRALGDGVAWLILLGVALPWYAYALQRHGRAFVDGFLMRHNVERFTTTLEGHGGSLLYYLLVLPLLALPWTPLLAALARQARALWRDALSAWLLVWAGFVLAFFSLSGTKLPYYALYGLTPLALLAGRRLADPALSRGWRRALLVSWAVAWLPVVLAPWVLLRLAPRAPNPLWQTLLATVPPWPWTPVLAALGGAAALVALLRRQAWQLRWLAAAWVWSLLVVGAAVPWWGQALQGPICRLAAVARARAPLPTVVQWAVNQPSFAWCLGTPTPRRLPEAGEWALVREDRPPPGDYAVCARERGFALWQRLPEGRRDDGDGCR